MLMGGLRTVVGVSGEVDEDRKKKVSVKAVDALIPIRFGLLGSSARWLLI